MPSTFREHLPDPGDWTSETRSNMPSSCGHNLWSAGRDQSGTVPRLCWGDSWSFEHVYPVETPASFWEVRESQRARVHHELELYRQSLVRSRQISHARFEQSALEHRKARSVRYEQAAHQPQPVRNDQQFAHGQSAEPDVAPPVPPKSRQQLRQARSSRLLPRTEADLLLTESRPPSRPIPVSDRRSQGYFQPAASSVLGHEVPSILKWGRSA